MNSVSRALPSPPSNARIKSLKATNIPNIVLVDVRHSIPLRFLDSQSPDAACCFTKADQTCRWQQGMDRKGSNSAEPFRKILQKEKAKPPVFKVMGRGRFSLNV
jgi:hypothetical protein